MSGRCSLLLAAVVVALVACSGQPRTAAAPAATAPRPAPAAELLEWRAGDPVFAQERAVEASGLTASGRHLIAVSEKYAALLRLDLATSPATVEVARLDVPPGAELEGVSAAGATLYLCDEAHAAVYAVDLAADGPLPSRLEARRVPLSGVNAAAGKTGLEGIAVSDDGERAFLLHERTHHGDRCQAEVYPLRRDGAGFAADGPTIVVPLADCCWRLADLALADGRLLALRSRYPGEVYEILDIDPVTASVRLVMDLTELGRSLRGGGWGNNLEGLTVGDDGDLYLIADNADTPRAQSAEPPPADERTTLLRLPRRR